MKPALIVIDMNKDFVYGRLGNERARNLVPRLRKLIESAGKWRAHYICL